MSKVITKLARPKAARSSDLLREVELDFYVQKKRKNITLRELRKKPSWDKNKVPASDLYI